MSQSSHEPTFTERLSEAPSFSGKKVAQANFREIGIRFIAGALTSIAAGLVTVIFGPRVGGVLLAFPAILAASLTLIERQEGSAEARQDARGAVLGGCAMAAFAGAGALSFGSIGGVLVLLIATCVWLVVALGGYFALWGR